MSLIEPTAAALIQQEAPGSRPLKNAKHERYARYRARMYGMREAAELAGQSPSSGFCTKAEARQDVRDRIAFLTHEDEEILREGKREIEAFLVAIQHAGDRRAYQRVPCALEVRLDTPAGSAATRLRDISLGGCLCDAVASCRCGDPATLIVAGGRIACRVVAAEADGTRLQFALDEATRHVVQGLLPAEAA